MAYFRLNDMDLANKRVLVRVDFNVPQDKTGKVTDDTRIRAVLPTLQYLMDHDAKVILMSHLGRPEGQAVASYSLKPVAESLAKYIKKPVPLIEDCVGEKVGNAVKKMKAKDVILLENVRFHKEEASKDAAEREGFAKQLAANADIFVNDAFGVSHRNQASVTDVTKFVQSCAGFLLEKEIDNITAAVSNPKQPFYAIIGGAKADKIGVIRNLLKKVDKLILGGVLANTFLKAQGKEIGASKFDQETLAVADSILEEGKDKIMLPVDALVADKFEKGASTKVVDIDSVPQGMMIVDIGPKTIQRYSDLLMGAKTIVWGGPLGMFEIEEFSKGTQEVVKAVAEADALSVVGGGDSAAAVEKFGYADKVTHVSTGGGASLEMFEGKKLPGVDMLEQSYLRLKK